MGQFRTEEISRGEEQHNEGSQARWSIDYSLRVLLSVILMCLI
jgi:hypothetical protein